MAQALVTAKLMADVAMEFNIGADLLSKSNRSIEKYLGAEKKSGDTVYVPIMDSGEVFDNLDLTSPQAAGKLAPDRDEVPVTVSPLVTAAQVSQEDLTLAIQNPEVMSKRVAKLADLANTRAYQTLVGGSQAFIAGEISNDVFRRTAFDAEANTVSSKLGGDTFGVTHPFTWNRLVTTLQANYAPNDKVGGDLFRNELGDFMGFKWSKSSLQPTITAAATEVPSAVTSITSDSSNFVGTAPTTVGGVAPASLANGTYFSQPFTLSGVYNVDALGNKTNDLKTFYLKLVKSSAGSVWSFAVPPVFAYGQGRLNCWIDGYTNNIAEATGIDTHVTPTAMLTAGHQYMTPAVIYKQNDFLVAVKGLEKFYGCDSFTIPTVYREKGILPLRGTAWTDPVKAATLFRIDVLLGMNVYTGLSVSSIYLPLN